MLFSKISGASRALAYARNFSVKGGFIVTATEQEAQKLAREMVFFDPAMASRVLYLPDNETLPFDLQRAPAVIMSQRASVFHRLAIASKKNANVLVVSASNCLRLCADLSFWTSNHYSLIPGISLKACFGGVEPSSALKLMGYDQINYVKSPGSWAERGLVVDIYPVGNAVHGRGEEHIPVRIKLDRNGKIISINKLDTLTNESVSENIQQLDIFPNRDFEISRELVEGFRKHSFDHHSDPRSIESYKIISSGDDHPELSAWIGCAEKKWTSVSRIAPAGDIVFDGDVKASMDKQWLLVKNRHEEIRHDHSRITPPIGFSWQDPQEFEDQISGRKKVTINKKPLPSGMMRLGTLSDALSLLKNLLDDGMATLFVMKSEVRIRHIKTMCSMLGHFTDLVENFDQFEANPSGISVVRGDLTDGYTDAGKYRVITETEVFGSSIESSFEEELGNHHRKVILQGLTSIEIGDPIVHALLGIGRFQGFESFDLGAGREDLLKIGFANEASTFVRVNDLDMVSRYTGADPNKAPLSKMGDASWMRDLQVAQKSAIKAAASLIEIRNVRQQSIGIVLDNPDEKYDAFCETFPYDETLDQRRAIEDILKDLTSGKPMDRLICGDVGFGKTEVAMRAAFMVANQGYQVAFLAPTTILAEQHYQSACKRFEDTSIAVALASRGTLSSDDLLKLKAGKPAILVGTHRLLQNDIEFGNLGLIIVDEEHRFGVRQKESLRSMRGNKHMLAMAATPIPRTLSLAISGIRDISIIATPPARRLSVRTLVHKNNASIIREALSRELAREGQVFFLHNHIETMDECLEKLKKIAPSARIRKIHGQMTEREMTEIMFAFRKKEFDVLVSTTVIEVGIDIPNANTLIIDEAGNLGLAQLHQLRGRVGRSSRQAYAYLLTKEREGSVSMRRLKAMSRSTNLGEGVIIARHDMEIRGIGEILGDEQSGHIHNIGFALYMRLLEHAIKAVEGGEDRLESAVIMSNVKMPILGKLPETFMPDSGERLSWYQRLMASDNPEELDLNIQELEDVYGFIPREINELRESILSHMAAKNLGISSIKESNGAVLVEASGSEKEKLASFLSQNFGSNARVTDRPRLFKIMDQTLAQVMERIDRFPLQA